MTEAHSAHAPALGRDFKVQKPDRILTLSCEDRPGIVREVSGALSSLGATIVSLTTQTRDAPMGDGVIFEADADVWLPLNVTAEAVQQAIEALSHDVVVDLTEVEEQ